MAVVGIEITDRALRAVRFEHFRRGRLPDQSVEVPATLPAGKPVGLAGGQVPVGALKELLQQVNVAGAQVAVAIPSAWCFFRSVAFPYRSAARAESTVRYALEGRLPGSVENYVIEPLSDLQAAGAKGSRMLVAACPRATVKSMLDGLGEAGVDPCIIQPAVAAVARAARDAGVNDDTALMRVDGDAEIVFRKKGDLVAALVVLLKGLDLKDGANQRRINARISFAVRSYQVSDGAADRDRVLVMAPGAGAIEGAAPWASLRTTASPTDATPIPGGTVTRNDLDSRWVAAIGAASAVRKAHAAPNLRRDDLAYAPHARRLERRLAAALALAVGIMALFSVATARRLMAVNEEIAGIRARRTALMKEVGLTHGEPTVKAMESALAQARKDATQADEGRTYSCLARWIELMRLVPAEITLDVIDINQKRIAVTARTANKPKLWELQRSAQASKVFMPDPSVVVRGTERGISTFTMELRFR